MSEDLDLLVERYLAGQATEPEAARLEALLSADPGALDRFLLDLDRDVCLRRALAAAPEIQPSPAVEAGVPAGVSERHRRRLPVLATTSSSPEPRTAWLVAALVLAALAVLWAAAGGSPPDAGRHPGDLRPRAGAPADASASSSPAEARPTPRGPGPRNPQGLAQGDRTGRKDPAAAPPVAGRPPKDGDRPAVLSPSGTPAPEARVVPATPPVEAPGPRSANGATVADAELQSPVLTLEAVRGEAFVRSEGGSVRAAAGVEVLPGQGLETVGPEGRLSARFADGTRLELGSRTLIREIFDAQRNVPGGRGKRFFLVQGALSAEVHKQPPDHPLVATTPQAQARVLGTTFRISVEGEDRGQTRLYVREGRVKFVRTDGHAVDVPAGYEAVARPGNDLVARPREASACVTHAGPALWLRADQGVVLSGTGVSVWADRSGNSRHASQTVPACQPSLVRGAAGGHPAVRFDGVDDYLSFTCPVTGLPGMTLFLVSSTLEERSCGVNGSGNAALLWHEAEDCATILLNPTPSRVLFYFGTGQKQAIFSAPRKASLERGFSLTTALKNGPEALLFVNGRESLRVADQKPLIGACEKTGQIGRGEGDLLTNRVFPGQYEGWTYFCGEISELVVFTRAVPDEDRLQIEEYLLDKYSLR